MQLGKWKLVALGVIAVGIASTAAILASAQGTTPAQPGNYAAIKQQQLHEKMVPAAVAESESPQPLPLPANAPVWVPRTTPEPHLLPIYHTSLPNGMMFQAYALSGTVYTDATNWTIYTGDLASDPSTGVIIVLQLNKNELMSVHKVAGAGKLVIASYTGSVLNLQSATGTGTYNIGSGRVSWTTPPTTSGS